MKHNIFIAQNISKLRPKLESEKCMVMPVGCAIDTEEHPRWNENNNGHHGTDNFGLDFRPSGGLVRIVIFEQFESWGYSYMGIEFTIWVDSGWWSKSNAQTLWNFWFFDWVGGGGGITTPVATQNCAFAIRPCKDYTSVDVPDGTKFYNAYTDGDGNSYDAVKIGNLLWSTENLKTSKFQDGTNIGLGENVGDFEYNDDTPLYTYYQYNSLGDHYKNIYGGLYNWYCVGNNIVSGDGWRIPRMVDLNYLKSYLINTKWCGDVVVNNSNVGYFVKSCRQVNHPLDDQCEVMPEGCAIATNEHPRWDESEYYGTNNFNFNLMPSGVRVDSEFRQVKKTVSIWSSTQDSQHLNAYLLSTSVYDSSVMIGTGSNFQGNPIRCVKDYPEDIYDIPDGFYVWNDYKDGSGNYYSAVRIGKQLWTVENLHTTKYQDGRSIPNVTNNILWGELTTGAYCWYNNDYLTYGQHYGALYNWYAVDSGLIDYNGYRVPSKEDFEQLTRYLTTVEWCNGINITENNIAQFLKSCRQVNHPLDK